jgi:hypothetical protein
MTLDIVTPAKDIFLSPNISFSLHNRRPYSIKNILLTINKNYKKYLNNLDP